MDAAGRDSRTTSRPWNLLAVSALLLAHVSGLQINHNDVFNPDDLFSYVTMPDVKAPRFDIMYNSSNSEKPSPGYWFVAPYTSVEPWKPIEDYKPHQIGPMIYDSDGELVWSGAYRFQDRSVFDFKSVQIDGKPHLSFIVNYDPDDLWNKAGSAMVLDSSYQVHRELQLSQHGFNMHEFKVAADGKSALMITSRAANVAFKEDKPTTIVTDNGFEDFDLYNGVSSFEWRALDHLNVRSSQQMPSFTTPSPPWDYVHLNSVDKSKVNGDYIISARYMDTIYRISAQDGSIVWKLGGSDSTFQIPFDMRFLGQHDARILDEYNSTVVLSFLNNGADDSRRNRPYSCGLIVALDTEEKTATLLHTYDRPDHQFTHGRGNLQVLPGGNVFANWADNAYLTEYTPGGDVIWEAHFSSKRYVTYRAYKFEFEGNPTDRPLIEAHASVTADAELTTVFHVSWNGATRVRSWKFYACEDDICEKTSLIGATPRTGFETNYTAAGLHPTVFAEAVDGDGKALGESLVSNITLSILPVGAKPHHRAEYGVSLLRLLVVSLLSTVITMSLVLCRRRRRRASFVAWRDPEKLTT